MTAVRVGDDRAFEELYQRYRRRIAAYIYGMVRDYGRAEDLTQDVFVSALRRMRETDRDIAFKPWIYEIAKNACIDQFRRRRAQEVSYDADEALGGADHIRLVSTGPGPDDAVDQKMSLGHLCGAFGGLSDVHYEILVMRELEGMSYREIGEKLGMSRPAVESTLFRARRRLSEEYEELVSGERCVRVQGIISSATAGTLGARDERRMARHVSHCQPCRRQAYIAGLDVAALTARTTVRAKLAALLPFPAFLRRPPTIADWSAQTASSVDPGLANLAKAAIVAATVAIAGVGVGANVVTHHGHGGRDATAAVPRAAVAHAAAGDATSSAGHANRAAADRFRAEARQPAIVPDGTTGQVTQPLASTGTPAHRRPARTTAPFRANAPETGTGTSPTAPITASGPTRRAGTGAQPAPDLAAALLPTRTPEERAQRRAARRERRRQILQSAAALVLGAPLPADASTPDATAPALSIPVLNAPVLEQLPSLLGGGSGTSTGTATAPPAGGGPVQQVVGNLLNP